MKWSQTASFKQRKPSDLLILPFWKGKEEGISAAVPLKELSLKGELEDFKGKEEEMLLSYSSLGKEPRLLLLGLGEKSKITDEVLRRAFGGAIRFAEKKKLSKVSVVLPKDASDAMIAAICDGLSLCSYTFSLKEKPVKTHTKEIEVIGSFPNVLDIAKRQSTIAQAVHFARDLVNQNADAITPETLVAEAHSIAQKHAKVKAVIFDKKRLEKEKMGLILAVSRGSPHMDPALIILQYDGGKKGEAPIVFVGKGVTYDTGGLNLKPTGSIEEMKCDMGGAAAALGTLAAAAELKLPVNLVVVIPTTENAIGPNSYKPGDVYVSYAGKTVEIGNTDAEGRLILADALAYAVKHFHPSKIIDIATLTGAMVIALGEEVTGMMSNNDALSAELFSAGEHSGERVWRLPTYADYRKLLDSDIADIKNIGGRAAGSITAALFLQEFVGETPWAHLDIAGTAYLSKEKGMHPKYATGVGVRLMIEFLARQG